MATAMEKRKNVERLIARCEGLVAGKTQFKGKEWKLSKYVEALCQQVKELEKYPNIDQDLLHSYQLRASVLQEVVRTSSHVKPAMPTAVSPADLSEGVNSSPESINVCRTTTGGNPMLMRSYSQRDARDRDELFAKTQSNGLRHRREWEGEVMLERQRRVQEEVAEEMMHIARSLKHSSLAAKEIITRDNQLLKRTNEVADRNIDGVERQVGRLKEHTRGCPCGWILLLLLVLTIFVAMVIFIRAIPKPS